jgi:hypothetical protein
MRGFLRPAVKLTANESQSAFAEMTRSKRSKVAQTAQTNLIKADQWARGEAVTADVAEALDEALKAVRAKTAKKK